MSKELTSPDIVSPCMTEGQVIDFAERVLLGGILAQISPGIREAYLSGAPLDAVVYQPAKADAGREQNALITLTYQPKASQPTYEYAVQLKTVERLESPLPQIFPLRAESLQSPTTSPSLTGIELDPPPDDKPPGYILTAHRYFFSLKYGKELVRAAVDREMEITFCDHNLAFLKKVINTDSQPDRYHLHEVTIYDLDLVFQTLRTLGLARGVKKPLLARALKPLNLK